MCKHGDVFSLRVLIGRGLDLLLPRSSNYSFSLRLIQFSGFYPKVGVDYDEDPPVPIPNTEVKLIRAENTWRASSLAQLAEHAAVNRRVVGSSPTGGAKTAGHLQRCPAALENKGL